MATINVKANLVKRISEKILKKIEDARQERLMTEILKIKSKSVFFDKLFKKTEEDIISEAKENIYFEFLYSRQKKHCESLLLMADVVLREDDDAEMCVSLEDINILEGWDS